MMGDTKIDPVTNWPIVGRTWCHCGRNATFAMKERDSKLRIVKVSAWCDRHTPKYAKELEQKSA